MFELVAGPALEWVGSLLLLPDRSGFHWFTAALLRYHL